MSRQFTGRFWKWVLPAGLAVGLFGFYAPAGADDEKEVEVKKVVIRKDGDEERKDEVRKDGDRKEERKEETRKDGDDKIGELARFVKELAGQVNELREEVRSLRSGAAGVGSPEEMKKRMAEMRKKFPAGAPEGLNAEKFRGEFEKRFRAEHEKIAGAREGVGGDVEAQIRRQIEQLNAELKRIAAAKDKEGDKKREEKEEKEGADAEEREAKERAAKKEAEAREDKEREEKKDDK